MCEVNAGTITGEVKVTWDDEKSVTIDIEKIPGAEGRILRVVLLPNGSWELTER